MAESDAFFGAKKTAIATTLAEARKAASLSRSSPSSNPTRQSYRQLSTLKQLSRPETATNVADNRQLIGKGTQSRPGSAVDIEKVGVSSFMRDSEVNVPSAAASPRTHPHSEQKTDLEWENLKKILLRCKLETENKKKLNQALNELVDALQSHKFGDSTQKGQTLRVLFKLVDQKNSLILLKVAKASIMVASGGSALLKSCTLLYKLSKVDKNDKRFHSLNLLEPILRIASTIPNKFDQTRFETILYATGTLKNVSNQDADNQKELAKLGGIERLSEMLSSRSIGILEDTAEKMTSQGKTKHDRVGHLLLQFSTCLRNLSCSSSHRNYFIKAQTVHQICALIDNSNYSSNEELMLNASRILSKLSLFMECKSEIVKSKNSLFNMVQMIGRFPDNVPMIIRICFVLGNVTGTSERSRQHLVGPCQVLSVLLPLFEKYSRPPIKQEHEELLVKSIRLIANLAISETLGELITSREELKNLLTIFAEKDLQTCEELVLNSTGAVTNLSFYSCLSNTVLQIEVELSEHLVALLCTDNEEAIIESARAFGNLSRSKQVRDKIAALGAGEVLVKLLDHPNHEIVYNVCGVLMNLMADLDHKALLPSEGIDKFVTLLKATVTSQDLTTSSITLKTLYNFSFENSKPCFSVEQCESLTEVLQSLQRIESEITENAPKEDVNIFKQVIRQLLGVLSGQHNNGPSEG